MILVHVTGNSNVAVHADIPRHLHKEVLFEAKTLLGRNWPYFQVKPSGKEKFGCVH